MPKYIEKKDDNSFILHVQVKPNSKKQDIMIESESITIYVRSRAIQNKANKELVNFLRKKFKISSHQIKIISGLKTSKKIIEFNFTQQLNENQFLNILK
ncbi:MAG: DUF167 domain-containing protein [Promethearchaeota archaeon]